MKHTYFFDDRQENFTGFDEENNIKCVLIPTMARAYPDIHRPSRGNTILLERRKTTKQLYPFANHLGMRYISYLLECDGKERYDELSGIQDQHVKMLQFAFIQKKLEAVLFDFDCTLSMMEGIHFPKNDNPKHFLKQGFTMEGYAEVLFGGTKRVEMLRQLFRMLRRNIIPYLIITNNSIPMTHPNTFARLMEFIDPSYSNEVNVRVNTNFTNNYGKYTLYREWKTKQFEENPLSESCSIKDILQKASNVIFS